MAPNTKGTKPCELIRLATVERRNGEQLRLSVDEFAPEGGEPKRYANVRTWYFASDGWRPGKSGVTLRKGELAAVIEALQQALDVLGEDDAA